jgi:hypothetical protein
MNASVPFPSIAKIDNALEPMPRVGVTTASVPSPNSSVPRADSRYASPSACEMAVSDAAAQRRAVSDPLGDSGMSLKQERPLRMAL